MRSAEPEKLRSDERNGLVKSRGHHDAVSFGALAARVRPGHIGAGDGPAAVIGRRRGAGPALAAESLGTPRGDGPSALADPTVAAKPATLLSVGGVDWAGEAITAVSALAGVGSARDLGEVLRRADVAPKPERPDECR